MRIFKNRGDFYFSKSNKKKSNEQKILILALCALVCFTVVFLLMVGINNDFSAKKFFAPDEPVTSLSIDSEEQIELPEVSGKTNLMCLVTKDESLLFVQLIQFDMDNKSYKVANLKPETVADGVSLYDTYKNSGSENVKNAVETLLSTKFDYYIQMENDDFVDFFNDLGKVNYAVASDIRYKGDNLGVSYSVNVKAGEQSLNGTQVTGLIRYYLEQNNMSAANDLTINFLQQQINSENYTNREELFTKLISLCSTNITVRDFSSAGDEFLVMTSENAGMGAYSASAQYDENSFSDEELQKLKGYFVK